MAKNTDKTTPEATPRPRPSRAPKELVARRLRWPNHLPQPPRGDVPWAGCREELTELTRAEQAMLVRQSRVWQQLMVPECERLDEERSGRGLGILYTSEQLELILLFGRACGHTTYKKTRRLLAGDDAEPRQTLGFDEPRVANNHPMTARRMKLRDGIPSEATMSRHKARFTWEKRREIWMAIEREALRENIATPELQQESRVINVDGSPLLTHYRCPKTSKKYPSVVNYDTGEVIYINDEVEAAAAEVFGRRHRQKAICVDGGYVPASAGPEKAGHGWNLVMFSSSSGVPLAWRLVPLNWFEADVAKELLQADFARDVEPHLDGVTVLSGDMAYNESTFRAELHKHGIVENIHLASHARRERTRRRVEKLNDARYCIDGYSKWFANGHREIFCRCGKLASKAIEPGRDGRVVVRTEGKCTKCGTISVRAGDWRFTEDERFVRAHPNDDIDARDWAFGNPLTYNDPNATVYGNARFGHNEGLHGTLSTRFSLIENKRWFRRKAQAEVDTAMTFTLIHILTLEQRKRKREAAAADPPPLPLAA